MAEQKFSDQPALAEALATGDTFLILNISTGRIEQATSTQVRTFIFSSYPSDLVTDTNTKTLANKTISALSNTITNLANASIKSGANIDIAKLGTGSVSTTVFDYLIGVRSKIQDQLDAITASLTTYEKTITVTLDGSKQNVIDEAEIQDALNLDNTLEYSISFEDFFYQAEEQTSADHWVQLSNNGTTSLVVLTQTDNGIQHFRNITIKGNTGGNTVKFKFKCKVVDAS